MLIKDRRLQQALLEALADGQSAKILAATPGRSLVAYARTRERLMLYLGVGFALIAFGSLLEGLLFEALNWDLLTVHIVESAFVLAGLGTLAVSLPPHRGGVDPPLRGPLPAPRGRALRPQRVPRLPGDRGAGARRRGGRDGVRRPRPRPRPP